MFLKHLIELHILVKKWLLLAQNEKNISASKVENFQKLDSALEEAIKIEKGKKSEIELKIIQQSISNQGKVDGSIASTASDFDKKMIPNNQQEVELVVDFSPSWVYLFAKNKKGLTTINKTKVEDKPTPYDITLNSAELNLELNAEYVAVAYLNSVEVDKDTQRESVSFIYDGSASLLIQVMNKKSQELEDQLEQNDKHYKQITKKREQIQLLLNEKHDFLLQTIKNNTQILIDDFCNFCNKTLTYPSISGSLDTQRKLIGSASSSFVQLFVFEGGKKIVSKVQSIGIIAVSVRTGTSIGGVYGAIIGAGLGIVIDVLVNKGVDAYVLDPTEDLTYKARRQKIDALLSKKKVEWQAEATEKLDQLLKSINNTTLAIFNNESIEELNTVFKQLEKYKREENPLREGDYYKELLKNWVFTHAGDSDDANGSTDKDIWHESLEELFKLGEIKQTNCDTSPAIRYQPDVYLYQFRGMMTFTGMSCDIVNQLTDNHNLLVQDIRDRLHNHEPNLKNSITDDCHAYETYYEEICKKMSFSIPSSTIKVQDEKVFLDFFKSSLDDSNENLVGVVSTILNDFTQKGEPFTLELEINLKKDESSVFFSNLRWFITKPNLKDSIKGFFSFD